LDGLAIAASLVEVRAAVEGGFVRSIYQPVRNAFVLHIFADRNRRILVAPRQAAIHLTALDIANPRNAGPFVMLLRRYLRGGRVVSVCQRGWDRVATIHIERRDGRMVRKYELVVELVGVHGNLFLVERGTILGSAHRQPENRPGNAYVSLRPQDKLDPTMASIAELRELLTNESPGRALARSIDGIGRRTADDLLRGLDDNASVDEQAKMLHDSLHRIVACIEEPSPRLLIDERRATFYPLPPPAEPATTFWGALDAATEVHAEPEEGGEGRLRADFRRAIARRGRTLEKLREWLDNAQEAERLQSLADLLMIHHTEIEPKAKRVVLTDPVTEREEVIPLLPSLNAIENAQRLYERAKRLRRGRMHVASRIERLESEVRLLEQAIADHDNRQLLDDRTLVLLGRHGRRAATGNRSVEQRRVQTEGFTIVVGRSAAENDRLLREAAPEDLWLHAKGFAGSHVIIKRGGRREIPRAVVQRAARLAARHSKARDERRVEVIVTKAKHVRKPRSATPGLVNVLKSDTLTVEL